MEGKKGESSLPAPTLAVVVWHHPASPTPERLLSTMAARSARGIGATTVTNPFMALAAVCRETRVAGRQPGQVALILVNPESLPEAAAVHDAVCRYAPGARHWQYTAGSNQPLRAIVEGDVEQWRATSRPSAPEVVVRPPVAHRAAQTSAPTSAYRTRRSEPSLRLTADGGMDQARKPADVDEASELAGHQESERPSQLLTPEELRMLLGEDEPG